MVTKAIKKINKFVDCRRIRKGSVLIKWAGKGQSTLDWLL